jgi:hypothetical protein
LDKVVGASVALDVGPLARAEESARGDGTGLAVTSAGLLVATSGRWVRREDTRSSAVSSPSVAGDASDAAGADNTASLVLVAAAGGRAVTDGGCPVAIEAGGVGGASVSAAIAGEAGGGDGAGA